MIKNILKQLSYNISNFSRYEGILLFLDKPLLNLYSTNQKNVFYLHHLIGDIDGKYTRWLIYRVKKFDLIKFLNSKSSLLELIKKSKNFYFVDEGNKEEKLYKVNKKDIPASYIPSEKFCFLECDFTKYALYVRDYFHKSN